MSGDEALFDTLRVGLAVALIQTGRDDLVTCRSDDDANEVVSRNDRREEKYDYLPVENKSGAIVGLFRATNPAAASLPAGTQVSARMDPLSDVNLVGEDASILDFIEGIDTKPYRLVVAGGGIAGIVTWSDLQKLPVRASLFGLITGLELAMSRAIRHRFADGEEWLRHLDDDARGRIGRRIKKSRHNDSEVDPLLHTDFGHKTAILAAINCPGPWAGTQRERDFRHIRKLRNAVAHARDYATSRKKANHVRRVAHNLVRIRGELVKWRPDRKNGETPINARSPMP